MKNEILDYKSPFFRVWKDRFTGVSPVVLGVEKGPNGTATLVKLVFDKQSLLYKKSRITYTNDEIPQLVSTLKDLGH